MGVGKLTLSFSSSGPASELPSDPKEGPGMVWDWDPQHDNTPAASEVGASIISCRRSGTLLSIGGGGGRTAGLGQDLMRTTAK